MWELDHKEGWALKKWCFWTEVQEKTLESPLDSKEIKPEYSLAGLMLKQKLQHFGHLMQKGPHWKRPWCWERLKVKGEGDRGWDGWMAFNGHEVGQTPEDRERQGSLVYLSPWVFRVGLGNWTTSSVWYQNLQILRWLVILTLFSNSQAGPWGWCLSLFKN